MCLSLKIVLNPSFKNMEYEQSFLCLEKRPCPYHLLTVQGLALEHRWKDQKEQPASYTSLACNACCLHTVRLIHTPAPHWAQTQPGVLQGHTPCHLGSGSLCSMGPESAVSWAGCSVRWGPVLITFYFLYLWCFDILEALLAGKSPPRASCRQWMTPCEQAFHLQADYVRAHTRTAFHPALTLPHQHFLCSKPPEGQILGN